MSIVVGTHDDVVLATIMSTGLEVVSCQNPADAASPVLLHSGRHVTQLGQAADYCHDLSALSDGTRLLVTGFYIDGEWRQDTTADPVPVRALIAVWRRRRDEQRAHMRAAAEQTAIRADCERIAKSYREALSRVYGVLASDVEIFSPASSLNPAPSHIVGYHRPSGRRLELVRV